ncbi:type II toxin-antitoxin system VapC family toxin [Agromyces sp. GXS1127]|uniref:type II toxin-antitoxin system VapC family toxin n=1 Tax=Agromyces sp. GXS1127 TaxID=3424181 RepID=UPI003D3149FB
MRAERERGLLDTNIVILRHAISARDLPEDVAISAVTLAELSAGVHLARGQDAALERARRVEQLQRVEHEFDPIPFDADAARAFGRITAAVHAIGRTPRRRVADLMIAATAAVQGLPLYTTNPGDFSGLEELVEIIAVARPETDPPAIG